MGQNQDLRNRAGNDLATRISRRDFLNLANVKEYLGLMEDAARQARLVEPAVDEFKPMYVNAPISKPSRRKFLEHAAILAGLIASGRFLGACATIEPVHFQGKTYGSWEAWLMSQDLIRGPEPLYRPTGNLPFDNHLNRTGRYAIDYEVPIGTPIVPTSSTYRTETLHSRTGGNELGLYHYNWSYSIYSHLDDYAKILEKGSFFRRDGNALIRDHEIDKSKVVAFSGNTGVGPGGGIQRTHLHLGIEKLAGSKGATYKVPPGIEPFKAGVDASEPIGDYGGRPVYWDGKTQTYETSMGIGRSGGVQRRALQQSLEHTVYTLETRLKDSDLDNLAKKELLKRRNDVDELRKYIGMRVLQKKQFPDGKPRYEFSPETFMYSLMLRFYTVTLGPKQEFVAMLPFISPFVKEIYQKVNPDVKL